MALQKDKVRRVRFTYDDDIIFLREVIAQNPIQNPDKWETIKLNLEQITGKTFLVRTLKQHLQLMLEVWAKKDEICKIKSGNEEPYSERDHLLQELTIICTENNLLKKKKKVVPKEKIIAQLGKEAREKFALAYSREEMSQTNEHFIENSDFNIAHEEIITDHDYIPSENNELVPSENNEELASSVINTEIVDKETKVDPPHKRNILTPSRRRPKNKSRILRKDTLGYLTEKQGKDYMIREKELELEERKLIIEERKLAIAERKVYLEEENFKLEKTERMKKLEVENERMHLELAERKNSISLLESQQKIIQCLLANISHEQ